MERPQARNLQRIMGAPAAPTRQPTRTMKLVLDTDILIDVLRGYEPALNWLATLTEQPAVVSVCVMELIQGCRNRADLQAVQQLIAPLDIWYPTDEEMRAALTVFLQGYLRLRLSILDAVVGSVITHRAAVLATFNTRHYRAIPDLTTLQPYTKGQSS